MARVGRVTQRTDAPPPGAGPAARTGGPGGGAARSTCARRAGVSTRHLSFVETGRAAPSRELLLALAEELDIPLRERNALLLAAGYAPAYTEPPWTTTRSARSGTRWNSCSPAHDPYPALVVDRWGDVQLANRGRRAAAGRAATRSCSARR